MTCFYCVYKWYQVNNLLEGKSKRQVDGRLLFNNRPGCSDFLEEKNSDLNFEVKTYLQSQNNTSQGCCKRTVNHSIISAPQVLQHILNIMKCSQYFWEVKRRGKLRLFWKLNVSIECHFNATQTRTRIPSPMMSTTKARNKVLGNKNFRPEPMKTLSVSFQ